MTAAKGRGRSPRPAAVAPADVAAAERWLARVWPAIALGGRADGTSALGGIAADVLLSPAIAAAARMLVGAEPVPGGAAEPASSASSPQPPRESLNGPELSLFGASVSAAWREALFLVALALIVGLLTLSFWREKGPRPRPRLR